MSKAINSLMEDNDSHWLSSSQVRRQCDSEDMFSQQSLLSAHSLLPSQSQQHLPQSYLHSQTFQQLTGASTSQWNTPSQLTIESETDCGNLMQSVPLNKKLVALKPKQIDIAVANLQQQQQEIKENNALMHQQPYYKQKSCTSKDVCSSTLSSQQKIVLPILNSVIQNKTSTACLSKCSSSKDTVDPNKNLSNTISSSAKKRRKCEEDTAHEFLTPAISSIEVS